MEANTGTKQFKNHWKGHQKRQRKDVPLSHTTEIPTFWKLLLSTIS